MQTIASFSYPPDFDIAIVEADALSVEADVAVFGRCKELKGHLESLAGAPFQTLPSSDAGRRRLSVLEHEALPWRAAISIDYRPRPASLEPQPPDGRYFRTLPHAAGLCAELLAVIQRACERYSARSILMIPLSWRNPITGSIAMAGAIWHYCYEVAVSTGDVAGPYDPLEGVFDRLFVRAFGEPEGGLANAKRNALAQIQEAARSRGYAKRFICVDRADPSPFVSAFRNEDGRLLKALKPLKKLDRRSWAQAPFEEVSSG